MAFIKAAVLEHLSEVESNGSCATKGNGNKKPKYMTDGVMRMGDFPRAQMRLYRRIKIERAQGIPFNGNFIRENMQELVMKYKPKN